MSEHGVSHITKGSILDERELFTPEESAHLKVRVKLIQAISKWMDKNELNNAQAARMLDVPRPRISKMRSGYTDSVSIDALVTMCAKADINVTFEAKIPRKKVATAKRVRAKGSGKKTATAKKVTAS